MLRNPALSILFCVPLCWQVPAQGDELKTVDEVIAKHIEAMGGRKALDSVKTMRMAGKSIMGGGMEAPLTIEFKRPNKVRVEFTFQGMTGIQAFDGKTGWFIMPFMGKTDPEKMSSDQVEAIEDQADFEGPLVDYKKKGHQVELIGKEEFEGSDAYKLKITKKGGAVEYHYLDAEYFLTTKMKGKRKFQGTEIEYEIGFGDFKKVGGLMFPHSIQQGSMGAGAMVFEKIEVNVKLPDDRFTMPEIKKEEAPKEDVEKTKEEKTGGD
ncbi:MAG: hypothetical protein WBE26_19540 [Phycisphaerae bacterium]